MSHRETATLRNDLINFVRGFCMGAADSVPGVSGGTVALILGHYYRLVSAISQFDRDAVKLLLARDMRGFATHVDLRFLVALGAGVLIALVSLASLMHWLLENRLPETLAVFMGLILASVWIVIRMIRSWSPVTITATILSAVAGYAISSLSPMGVDPSLVFLFFSAVIAITAMILPGISGSFILVLLGVYHYITGLIKGLPRGEVSIQGCIEIVTFAAGCVVGLAAFTRILRWLLEHHQNTTFAALLGLMIGSLRRVWPLQMPTEETAHEKFSHRTFEILTPAEWPTSIWPLITLTITAAIVVIALEMVASKPRPPADSET